VRYAWANNPAVSLYSADGQPASPFRTDRWPGITPRRPRAAWAYRTILNDRSSAVAVALHEDLWLGYDIEDCGLYLAWRGGEYYIPPAQHPDVRRPPRGQIYYQQERRGLWSIDGADAAASFVHYQIRDGGLTLRFEIARADGTGGTIEVAEVPRFDATVDGDVRLVRTFTVDGLPDGATLRLRLEGTSDDGRWEAEGVGSLDAPQAPRGPHDATTLIIDGNAWKRTEDA
jgi:hypothetical protein